ncbi:DMT family transporter [Oryzibacter oryziterrae]|uniref:DMT family transporter n=1 Tax=Oryzibacter oryziterrae TaxID=2766474 RepID=UPI001F486A9D|nr:DMT family transporter [Oryzibacter oryziterrae]
MSTLATPRDAAAPHHSFGLVELGLYGLTIFAWSTSWIALKWQVGVVAPEVSVAYRFLLAAAVMFAWLTATGQRLRFPASVHLRFALQGALIFSTNFYLFYRGGAYLASGLLSVVFSLASVGNLLLSALLLGQRIERRVALGALTGFMGIGLLFWPEIAGTDFNGRALTGLGFCVAGTLFFCSGSILASANQRSGLPIFSTTAWGMAYGAVLMLGLSLVNDRSFAIDVSAKYIGGMLWLALVSSVAAFAAYLTLMSRIGAARAGYATVIFPIFALAISSVEEGYVWTPLAVAGLIAVVAGNLIILSRPNKR